LLGGYCWLTVNAIPAMVSVALRAAPVALGSTLNWTVPPPDPDAPSVITTHAAPLTAVQVQPPDVDTDTVPTPPVDGIICDVDPRLNVQPLSCVTVTVRPATVAPPLRAGPVFAANARSTEPLPLPAPPAVTVIQGAPLVAVHPQDAAAVTSILAPPPAAGVFTTSGETTNEQPLSWTTVSVWPAMAAVPVRDGPLFGWTSTCTDPLPVPLAPDEIVSHGAWLAAVQPQRASVVTTTGSDPPETGTDCDEGLIEYEHPLD